jgi:nucleotide-binding universal stress UspA family protein
MPHTIIAGVDPRRPGDMRDAVAVAARLAAPTRAELLAVAIVPPSHAIDLLGREREVTRAVETAALEVDGAFAFEARAIPSSSPARILHELADRMDAAAVVIGSSIDDPDDGWLAGSVAELLLHGGSVPVAIAPRGYADRAGRALGAIGVGFLATEDAREALRHAVRLAVAADAELRVITVVEPFLFSHIAMGREHEGIAVEHALAQRARASLSDAVAALPAEVQAREVLLEGSPAPTLRRLAADVGLLVLGSRGYGPSGTVLLGPVSRDLVRAAPCPVMVVPRAIGAGTRDPIASGVAVPADAA